MRINISDRIRTLSAVLCFGYGFIRKSENLWEHKQDDKTFSVSVIDVEGSDIKQTLLSVRDEIVNNTEETTELPTPVEIKLPCDEHGRIYFDSLRKFIYENQMVVNT